MQANILTFVQFGMEQPFQYIALALWLKFSCLSISLYLPLPPAIVPLPHCFGVAFFPLSSSHSL